MIIVDTRQNMLHFGGETMQCAIGKNGSVDASGKYEGDGKTPLGTFMLRELFWREDKLAVLVHNFVQATVITPQLGWCDAPESPHYNKLVELPFAPPSENLSYEDLWRTDNRYDVIIPIGYNDAPVIAGRGSAIFFHIAEVDLVNATNNNDKENCEGAVYQSTHIYQPTRIYKPTEGCIAIALPDMLRLLPHINHHTIMQII